MKKKVDTIADGKQKVKCKGERRKKTVREKVAKGKWKDDEGIWNRIEGINKVKEK